jgi:hypothetical protein
VSGQAGKPTTRLATATSAKSGSTCTAVIDGIEVTVQCARDLTVASGDVLMLVLFAAQWFAVGRAYTAAPVDTTPNNVAPPQPRPTTVTGTTVISPVETRSYRSGGWRSDNDDVYQGQYAGNGNHTGCAFYGNKPRSLSGVTVTSARIKVRRPDAGGMNAAQATTLRQVTQKTRPAGAPTLTGSTAGPSLRRGQTTNSFAIPTSWGQDFVDGNAGGLAVYESDGSPYVILAGRSRWSAAFTMTISWQRST